MDYAVKFEYYNEFDDYNEFDEEDALSLFPFTSIENFAKLIQFLPFYDLLLSHNIA